MPIIESDLTIYGLLIFEAIAILALTFKLHQRQEKTSKILKDFRQYHLWVAAKAQVQSGIIHDDLLQKIFALRRSLELINTGKRTEYHVQIDSWVEQLEKTHKSLTSLNERFLMPYLENDLSTSVTQLIEIHSRQNPQRNLSVSLKNQKMISSKHGIFIVAIIDALFTSKILPSELECCEVELSCIKNRNQLKIGIHPVSDSTSESISDEFSHLFRLFEILNNGEYFSSIKKSNLQLFFTWPVEYIPE